MEWRIEEKSSGKRIIDYLRQEKSFSRRIIKALKFEGGEIIVNEQPSHLGEGLHGGDVLRIIFPPEEKGHLLTSQAVQLDIVYEDEAVLVIDKQAGIATIPSFHHPKHTIANGILAHYAKQHIPYTVHIVTRLDRDTSGLLLVAKHRYSHSLLSQSQKKGEIQRTYQAIIEGKMTSKKGTIDARIGRKDGSIIERTVREDGQRAITHYEVLQERATFSLVSIALETGRTHQIRVHFAWLHHPLIGDDLYGGSRDILSRQALHCAQLSFIHPFTKEKLMFTSSLPADMKHVMNNLPQSS